MKRRSLLAMILSLVMCMGLAMPVWAAEVSKDVSLLMDHVNLQIEDIAIDSCVKMKDTGKFHQFEVKLAGDEKSVTVFSTFDDTTVEDIENYLLQAKYAIAQENQTAKIDEDEIGNITYNYVGENETLCYTVIDGQASLYVSEPISERNIDEFGVEISDFQYDTLDENMLEPMATADRFNKGGIGIRGYASKSGNYISATINNPYVVTITQIILYSIIWGYRIWIKIHPMQIWEYSILRLMVAPGCLIIY